MSAVRTPSSPALLPQAGEGSTAQNVALPFPFDGEALGFVEIGAAEVGGGAGLLCRGAAVYQVRVNGLTGAPDVAPRRGLLP